MVSSVFIFHVYYIRYAVPAFNVTEGATFLIIHFEPNYHMAGPPPHGHEIVVWEVNMGTTPGPLSYYFELSVLEAEVKKLQPATNYTLYARSNSIRTSDHGRWTARAVSTTPVGESQSTLLVFCICHISSKLCPVSAVSALPCVLHLSLHVYNNSFLLLFILFICSKTLHNLYKINLGLTSHLSPYIQC